MKIFLEHRRCLCAAELCSIRQLLTGSIRMSTSTAQPVAFETFAVLDLETTGLDTNRVGITELAVVAVTADDFRNSSRKLANNTSAVLTLPRVLSKICLPINPAPTKVEFGAARVSGLDNFLLSKHKNFASAYGVLASYFAHLPSPICVVAHNGKRFDFKILKRLISQNNSELSDDLYFVDSLTCLNEIDKGWFDDAARKLKEENERTANSHFTCIEEENAVLASLNEITVDNRAVTSAAVADDGYMTPPSTPKHSSNTSKSAGCASPIYAYTIDYGDRIETWKTPPKQTKIDFTVERETSDVAQMVSMTVETVVSMTEVRPNNIEATERGKTLECRAKNVLLSQPKPTKYSQAELYNRLFNAEQKNAHTAEGDCLSLLEILLCYGESFVKMAGACAVKEM